MSRFLTVRTVEIVLAHHWSGLPRQVVMGEVARVLGPVLFKPDRVSRIDKDTNKVTLFMHSFPDGERYQVTIGEFFTMQGAGFDIVRVGP